jgi:small redox-active disulfide protein 2
MIRLEVLGVGCDTCDKLAENTAQAARELGLDFELVKVTRIEEIKRFRVIALPALVVDGVVKSVGVPLDVEAIKPLLPRP